MSKFDLIKKFMCPDCFVKKLAGKPICEKCENNFKKFNRLTQIFIECKRLNVKLGYFFLHKTMFNRIVKKSLVLDAEGFNFIKELHLEESQDDCVDYLLTFPKYVDLLKKEKCEECNELLHGGDCDCYCEGCGDFRWECSC